MKKKILSFMLAFSMLGTLGISMPIAEAAADYSLPYTTETLTLAMVQELIPGAASMSLTEDGEAITSVDVSTVAEKTIWVDGVETTFDFAYDSDYDSPWYKFDFNGTLETTTTGGFAKNKLIADIQTGWGYTPEGEEEQLIAEYDANNTYLVVNGEQVGQRSSAQYSYETRESAGIAYEYGGNWDVDGGSLPTLGEKYTLDKPITLSKTNNWSVEMRLRPRIKGVVPVLTNTAASMGLISVREWGITVEGAYAGSAFSKTGNLQVWNSNNMNTVKFTNTYADETATLEAFLNATSKGTQTASGSANDMVISYMFSESTGSRGFMGKVDYIYICTDTNQETAMEWVQNYRDALYTSEDIATLSGIVDEYDALDAKVKSYLTRDVARLDEVRYMLADTTDITTIGGVALTQADCDGTGDVATPYTATIELPYDTTEVTADDVTTDNQYAKVTVTDGALANTSLSDTIEFTVEAGSAVPQKVYYKITVTRDGTTAGDEVVSGFYTTHGNALSDSATDDEVVAAKEAFNNLSDEDKAKFICGEETIINAKFDTMLKSAVNTASDEETLKTNLAPYSGIYEEINSGIVAKWVSKYKPETVSSVSEFETYYNKAVFVNNVSNIESNEELFAQAEQDLFALIAQNPSYVKNTDKGINIATVAEVESGEGIMLLSDPVYEATDGDYTNLSDTEKAKYLELLGTEDLTTDEDIALVLRQIMILAEVQSADSSKSMQNAVLGLNQSGDTINNNTSIIFPSDDEDAQEIWETYNKKVTTKVFGNFYNKKSSINTYADILANFDTAVDESPNKSNGGGGGGGGGGAVPPTTTVPPSNPGFGTGEFDPTGDNLEFPDEVVRDTYTDIASHWGKECIEIMSTKGIIDGYPDGSFKPDNTVTRAEFIKMAVTAFVKTGASEIAFGDCKPGDWYYDVIARAVGAGMIEGGDDNMVRPNNNITREDAVIIIYRNMKDKLTFPNKTYEFKDKDQLSDYCVEGVNDMAYAGVISGKGSDRFAPKDNMTRAEAATLISNALDYLMEASK